MVIECKLCISNKVSGFNSCLFKSKENPCQCDSFGWSTVLYTKPLQVLFLVRVHALMQVCVWED